MSRRYKVGNTIKMIFGLDGNDCDWLASQLQPLVESSPRTVDGLSVEPRGVNEKMELVVELHGSLTPAQLRILADAIENVPANTV